MVTIRSFNRSSFSVANVRKGMPKMKPAHVSDFKRLAILREEGGIYLDTDVIPLRTFDTLLSFDSLFGEQAPSPPDPTKNKNPDKTWICNAVMATKPNNPVS